MRLSLLVPALLAAVVAGCATEGPYYSSYGYGYDSGYYGPGYSTYYDYGPYYYGPSYYGPDYFAFSYQSGDGYRDHDGKPYWNGTTHSWNSTRSWQQGSTRTEPRTSGAVRAQPRASSRTYAQSHPRNNATRLGTARGRGNEGRRDQAERQQRNRVASASHGPDREHGG